MIRPPADAPRPRWVAYAIGLAAFTVGFNLLEGLVSVGFGWADESLSLFGFGVDSFIEVGSAALILWRLRSEGQCDAARRITQERRATQGIGWLLLLLGAGAALGAVLQFVLRRHPGTTRPGLVISAVSIGFMLLLWREKSRAASALESPAVRADAACSLACARLSAVVMAGSLAFLAAPSLWWMDSVATFALAAFIGREGLETVRAASREDFAGGCGCH